MRNEISTVAAPKPAGAYSQGVRWGDLLFLAGQGPFTPDGKRVAGTIAERTRRTLENLEALAQAGGSSLRFALRVGVYLEDLDDWAEMDEAYRGYFGAPLPARTTVEAGLKGLGIEIDAIVGVPADAASPGATVAAP